MPIAIALLMGRKKRYMIISDKHGVIWNETYRYLGLLLNCDGKKITVSSTLLIKTEASGDEMEARRKLL